jgi:hypothetical protein
MKVNLLILSAALTSILSACGGGGSSVSNESAEGLWSGTASTGYQVSAMVLENNEVWGIYTANSSIYGALYGTAAVSGNTLTITGYDFNFATNQLASGSYSGTVSSKSSMSLSSANNGTVTLAYDATYDTAASQASATGTWGYQGRSGGYYLTPDTVTIDSSGAFTISQTSCTSTGTVTPRSSGKNAFSVSITSVGAGCAVPGEVTGLGHIDTAKTPNTLLIFALKADKTDGIMVVGAKQ